MCVSYIRLSTQRVPAPTTLRMSVRDCGTGPQSAASAVQRSSPAEPRAATWKWSGSRCASGYLASPRLLHLLRTLAPYCFRAHLRRCYRQPRMHHLGVRLPAWLTRDRRRICHAQSCIRLDKHRLPAWPNRDHHGQCHQHRHRASITLMNTIQLDWPSYPVCAQEWTL